MPGSSDLFWAKIFNPANKQLLFLTFKMVI